MILPFLVGFAPPRDPGAYVSLSADRGRYYSASGCSHPHMYTYQEEQAGAYYKGNLDEEGRYQAGVGIDFNALSLRDKECTREDCANGEPITAGKGTFWSPYVTFDSKWVGVLAGAQQQGLPYGENTVPRGMLRLGRTDFLYATMEFLNGQPYASGGLFQMGWGARWDAVDLWIGVGNLGEGSGGGAKGMLGYSWRGIRARVMGSYWTFNGDYSGEDGEEPGFSVRRPDYSIGAGLEYALPFRH